MSRVNEGETEEERDCVLERKGEREGGSPADLV